MILGFSITALGLVLILQSNLGMGPWGALAVGVSRTTILTVGQVTQLISLVLVVISWLLKVMPSLVTVMNMFFIGLFMDMFLKFLPLADRVSTQILFFVVGLAVYSFGIAFYLSFSNSNSGPRESLMLGLSRVLRISLRKSRIGIDVTVLVIAAFMRGPIGVGTLVFAISAGPLIQGFLRLAKYQSEPGKTR